MKIFLLTILTLLLLLPGCQKHPLQQLGATSVSQKVDKYELAGGDSVTVDILFVVDDSGTMAEEQTKLVENISKFMEKLKQSSEKTSYHIGVITTSIFAENQALGTEIAPNRKGTRIKLMEDGKLTPIVTGTPTSFPIGANPDYTSCDAERTNGKLYLSNDDDATIVENLKNTIRCLGTDGSLIERPFDSIEKALTKRTENSGFLRDEAKLMIIIITDEDDCSTGLDPSDLVIHSSRYFDCVEQSDAIARATTLISDKNEIGEQNKLKNLEYYLNMLKEKKGSWDKIGFAAIVGPDFCWSGDINNMGMDLGVPTPALNCSYVNADLTREYSNYSTCEYGLPCECSGEGETVCVPHSFFTSCFNNIGTGIPNEVPIIDTEHSCSERSLNGFCEDGQHCEVTTEGVKCVDDSCSSANPNGTCSADKICTSGVCELKVKSSYSQTAGTISGAIPGKRYLEFYKLLADKKQNTNDLYKYSICLEDFGSPLSLIGAKLAEAKCEYNLVSKTDDPCNLVINIFPPKNESLPAELRGDTSLGAPWSYTIIPEAVVTDGYFRGGELVTPEVLKSICESDRSKPFASREGITQYLEKVPCSIKDENGDYQPDGDMECLKILFPNACPLPGSEVKIFYGVSE